MSREHVEVVRRAYDAFNRGDVEGMAADFAPTFEYVSTGAIPGFDRDAQGPEGMKEFVGWMREEFDAPRFEIHKLIDAGDQILVHVAAQGRGKQSGVESDWHFWQVWTLREGKVIGGEGFISRAEALEAAGLSG